MSIYRGSGGSGDASNTATLNEVATFVVEAEQSATDAAASATASASSATSSASSASAAQTSETNAALSETNAATSETNAAASETAAATSETNAATSATNAANSATAAASSATDAQTAQTAAETAQTAAEAAQASTESLFDQFGDQYLGSKASDPTVDNDGDPLTEGDVYWNSTDNVLKFYTGTAWVAPEDVATTAATNASNSATAAATSETNAATSATSAASSATSAGNSATAASSSATSAAASASSASSSAANAAASEASVAADAATASAAATTATNEASAASTSASTASTAASNASTSETNAAASASSAATSASTASTAATSAAASYDAFDDRYLGAKASDPSTDNDGDALTTGALYFNTAEGVMKVYDGSEWDGIKGGSATLTLYKYTATSGQTVFTGADDSSSVLAVTGNNLQVTLNGIMLELGTDYTVTATAVTLTTGATTGDEVNIYAFDSFSVATYTQFPFFKASGASASIDLTGNNSIPFFKADSTANNIALA